MRDEDRMLDLPAPEFGSGIIGVCDICGTRQAVIVLAKERYRLCVIDFLNKAWIKSDKTPGSPAPLYRSDRVEFPSSVSPKETAPAIVLTPSKTVRHPVVLITPDVYGLTTTLLDAAIRFAREGFEVLIPDVGKTDGLGPGHHLALRTGAMFAGGVAVKSPRVNDLVRLYEDAFGYLLTRDMVDPAKSAVFGTSYGASLALAVAAGNTRLSAVALAYPMPVRPADLAKLVNVPLLCVAGSSDRRAARAVEQLRGSSTPGPASFEFTEIPGARHNFLARDLRAYDLDQAEAAWSRILTFLKARLMPPPPRPPVPPIRPAGPLDPVSPAARPAPTATAPSAPKPGAPAPAGPPAPAG
jgi:carboxymethylenebutenolidase